LNRYLIFNETDRIRGKFVPAFAHNPQNLLNVVLLQKDAPSSSRQVAVAGVIKVVDSLAFDQVRVIRSVFQEQILVSRFSWVQIARAMMHNCDSIQDRVYRFFAECFSIDSCQPFFECHQSFAYDIFYLFSSLEVLLIIFIFILRHRNIIFDAFFGFYHLHVVTEFTAAHISQVLKVCLTDLSSSINIGTKLRVVLAELLENISLNRVYHCHSDPIFGYSIIILSFLIRSRLQVKVSSGSQQDTKFSVKAPRWQLDDFQLELTVGLGSECLSEHSPFSAEKVHFVKHFAFFLDDFPNAHHVAS
jgi:hypothetical protein